MTTVSSHEGVLSLPAEIWRPILILAKEPNAALACRLFQGLYGDPCTLLATLDGDLKLRGIDVLLTDGVEADKKLEKAKSSLVSRVITVASQEFMGKLKPASPFSIFTYIRAFKEEEAIALCRLFGGLFPQIKGLLDIDQSFIEKLPSEPLQRAACIRTLLQENQEKLKQVEDLNLKGLGLTLVPEELNLFTGLKKVDLTDNWLAALPASLGKSWTSLQELSLDHNPVSVVRRGFGASWVNLKTFSLVKGYVVSLPEDFGAFWTEIKMVNLNNNKLTHIPHNLGISWKGLERVSLDSNQLTDLPSDLSERWPELKFIRIKTNPVDAKILQDILNGFNNLLGAF